MPMAKVVTSTDLPGFAEILRRLDGDKCQGRHQIETAQALLTDKVYYGCFYRKGADSMSAKPAVKPAAKPTRAAARSKPEPAVTTSASIDAQVAAFLASGDRKSTRLNSSHVRISYAVF